MTKAITATRIPMINRTIIDWSMSSSFPLEIDSITKETQNIMYNEKSRTASQMSAQTLTSENSSVGCKSSRQGVNYTGTASRTVYGDVCQAWHEQTPHNHSIGSSSHHFPDADIKHAQSYCRNPSNGVDEFGPWCYTSNPDVRKANCEIPYCSDVVINRQECKMSLQGEEYAGTMNQTMHGHACQVQLSSILMCIK